MKNLKLSLLSIFMLTAFAVSAQLSLGIRGGVNASNLNMTSDGESEKSNSKIGFNVGIQAQYMFNPILGIQSGLYYQKLGNTKSESISLGGIASAKYKSTMSFDAIQLPLHLAFKTEISPKTNIVFHGGPYISYIRSAKMTFKGEGEILGQEEKTNETESIYDDIKKIDSGIGFGVDFEFGNFIAGTGFDLGLADIVKGKEISLKTRNAYLSIGFKF